MANQNPQPEIYTTYHDYAAGATPGTQIIRSIFTNQNSNEEVRIGGISVSLYSNATGAVSVKEGNSLGNADNDFDVRIKIGNSYVPSQAFDIASTLSSVSKTLFFPTPILVLFQQPISVEVTWRGNGTNNIQADGAVVVSSLHGELSLAQAACVDGQMGYPQEIDYPMRRNA